MQGKARAGIETKKGKGKKEREREELKRPRSEKGMSRNSRADDKACCVAWRAPSFCN